MDDTIARAIATAANQMNKAPSVEDTLEVIVRSAAEALPAFAHVGVSTLDRGGDVTARAATSDLVRELQAVQTTLDEGPFVDSLKGAQVVVAGPLEHDRRWPVYVPEAVSCGVRSQMAVRLHLEESGIAGGVNLYSTVSDHVESDDVTAAALFATHAALALGQARHVASLTQAVETRQAIGLAIGLLMERYTISEKAAHAYLWRASSHANVKVRDLAAELVKDADHAADVHR